MFTKGKDVYRRNGFMVSWIERNEGNFSRSVLCTNVTQNFL